MAKAATVILPIPVKSNFDYYVPPEHEDKLGIGKRVLVNFGKRKIYTGVIKHIFDLSPDRAEMLKPIEEILDDGPILSPEHLRLFEWISFYYMCTEGEVFKAALPAGLKPESAMRVKITEDLVWEELPLSNKEHALLETLEIQPILNFKEIADLWQVANPSPRLRVMESRKLIKIFHQVEDAYKPKFKTFLQLAEDFVEEDNLRAAFDSFTPRQHSQEDLLTYIVAAFYQEKIVPKSETLKELGLGAGVVKSLVKKGFIKEVKVRVDRLEMYGYDHKKKEIVLTEEQQKVLASTRAFFQEIPLKPVLLHGVTGSGKTHIYIELIKDVLKEGRQILYLLPEITLTKQIIDKVKSELGEKVGVYHSKFNDQERVEIWNKVLNREYEVVIGVRSSIFLPFQDLGLIVVDEEHDKSFKQFDPSPRYNARDLAIYYSSQENIPVILGSATPAFESFQNAKEKYHLLQLKNRAIDAKMPSLEIVDMRLQRKKRLNQGIFSSVLKEEIEVVLKRGEQIILFQNRRGYAPFLICETCGTIPMCINCDISLTFHKEKQHLRCHYCGYTSFKTHQCGNCNHYALRESGVGTERIEEEVKVLFPDATVQRMDLDTTRTKFAYQHIIHRFEKQHIDILVGTQMVSKGLDFENVTLVGVINADTLLSFPDFRAYENAFQLLKQVSGRAGRSKKSGKVIIQSMMPENVVLTSLESTYEEFYHKEILQRKQLKYPPFTRLIRIELRHKDKRYLEQESVRLNNLLRPYFGSNILGPEYALVARLRNQYRMQFLIKLSKGFSVVKVREKLQEFMDRYYERAPQKTLRIIIDVDPS